MAPAEVQQSSFIRDGKCVIILHGRYAGKKAVVVSSSNEGTKERPYGHALVVGVERAPLKVNKSMGAKRLTKRSKVKPFIKYVNYNHIMPTRYAYELDFKEIATAEATQDQSKRLEIRKTIRKLMEDRYKSGKNKWFFQKLRF